jgi:hypothetical protein
MSAKLMLWGWPTTNRAAWLRAGFAHYRQKYGVSPTVCYVQGIDGATLDGVRLEWGENPVDARIGVE